MTTYIKEVNYIPGTYAKRKPKTSILTEYYAKECGRKVKEKKLPPSICFSRKIGVGALEIADLLAGKISYPVFEREIIEQMSDNAHLNKKTITFFDERYPGKLQELAAFLFAEKSYVMSDYVRHLFRTVLSIADINTFAKLKFSWG